MISKICIMLMLVQHAIGALVARNCKNLECPTLPKHYEELGCKPIINEGECCASSYKCPDLRAGEIDKCYYKDNVLNVTQYLKSSSLGGMCSAACYCARGYNGKPAEFQCAHVDCPEYFNRRKPKSIGKKCVHQYDRDHCCAIKTMCDDDVDKLAKCDFEGKSYREGQKIYPSKQCYECFCTKDFDNRIAVEDNKNCNKIDCGISLRNTGRIIEGCIPVYYKTADCCPIGWRCPGEKHMIENDTARNLSDKKARCKFGRMEFRVGESLDLDNDKCQKCTCTTPPMLHCIETC